MIATTRMKISNQPSCEKLPLRIPFDFLAGFLDKAEARSSRASQTVSSHGRHAMNRHWVEVRRKMLGCTLHQRSRFDLWAWPAELAEKENSTTDGGSGKASKRRAIRQVGGSRVRVERKLWAAWLVLVGYAWAQPLVATAGGMDARSRAWVRYYAEMYQLPTEFVEAIIDQESAWNPQAVSKKGAVGLMQLMPKTAARFGVRDRFRIEQNIQGGVAYLAWLKRRFNADLRLVTAAYYAGEAPIQLRGLTFANADVHRYVSQVAERYRARRTNSQ